jgi:hypothetical protein
MAAHRPIQSPVEFTYMSHRESRHSLRFLLKAHGNVATPSQHHLQMTTGHCPSSLCRMVGLDLVRCGV